MSEESFDIVCIGGGAAGFFGAISCAELAAVPLRIAILEATGRPLTKVKISGGGRCNVTHYCFEPKKLVAHYPRGGKALLSGFYKFGPEDMIAWLAARGVPVVAEADGRMFPNTHSSQTIIDCFSREVQERGIVLRKGVMVKGLVREAEDFLLTTRTGTLRAKFVLLATGSMPQGHALATSLGHSLTPMAPSLFTFESKDAVVAGMAGVSVDKVNLTLIVGESKMAQTGPILFTHWGVSGPAVLKLSAFAARELYEKNYIADLVVNWAPNLNREMLLDRMRALRAAEPRKKITSTKGIEVAKRLWVRLVEIAGLADKVWAETGDSGLRKLVETISAGRYRISGKGEFKEEFVTCGGVDLAEVDLKTFASRRCDGLYLAGEILDVDGITGGFNFQNAWTSSRLAAQSIVDRLSYRI